MYDISIKIPNCCYTGDDDQYHSRGYLEWEGDIHNVFIYAAVVEIDISEAIAFEESKEGVTDQSNSSTGNTHSTACYILSGLLHSYWSVQWAVRLSITYHPPWCERLLWVECTSALCLDMFSDPRYIIAFEFVFLQGHSLPT